MLIDWFTVIAQLLNFLILIWLLKRFLYQPIIKAMESREKLIADNLASAELETASASASKLELERLRQELELQRVTLLEAAAAQAAAEHEALLQDARLQVKERQTEWQRMLDAERESFLQTLQQEVQEEFFTLARQALRTLADHDLEERIVFVFLRELAALQPEQKESFFAAAQKPLAAPLLRSAFPLPESAKSLLRETLAPHLPIDATLSFEVAPHLLGGIELAIGGEKLAWSFENHLRNLRQQIEETIERAEKNE